MSVLSQNTEARSTKSEFEYGKKGKGITNRRTKVKSSPRPSVTSEPNMKNKKLLTAYVLNNLRTLKARNPGDTYYDEYLKHTAREGDTFYDQYCFGVERVMAFEPKAILEIGVRTGTCISNLLSAYRTTAVIDRIVLNDIWSDGFASPEIVKMNLRALNLGDVIPKIEFIVGDSRVEVPKITGLFDYILVDGDHDKKAALADLDNVIRLCAPGGVIVFDDISPYGCALIDVWEDFKKQNNNTFIFGQDMAGKGTGWAIKRK